MLQKVLKLNHKRIRNLFFSFTVLLNGICGNVAYAKHPKVTYNRSHSPLWGGFDKVTVHKVENGDYLEYSISCIGNGDVKCTFYNQKQQVYIDLILDFSQAEIGFIENTILSDIDERVFNDELNGNKTFSMISAESSGVAITFLVE